MQSNEEKLYLSEKTLAQALELKPEEIAYLIRASYVYYEQGHLKQAQEMFEAMSLLDDSNSYVHGILGSIYQKQQRFEEAISCYSRALNLFPQDIYSRINRGEVYWNQGKLLEAAHDFEAAIHLDSSGNHPAANRARFLAILARDALRLPDDKGQT
jgi:tetratricopeptide (TPR) repeat protein